MLKNTLLNRNIHPARILILFMLALGLYPNAYAQKTVSVHGTATYVLSENDNVTIKDAKVKAIEMAKVEALKEQFGMLVVSDVINSDRVVNDEFSSFYISDTSSSVKGEWVADEREPQVTIECINGDIFFTAEVWFKAREITRVLTDIKWQVLKDKDGQKVESTQFNNGERFFVKFRSPSDGYVAIYLITDDKETACLLPYRKDNTGRYQIKGGKDYTFFDKTTDPAASYYKLSTNLLDEKNRLVIIYSPKPFTKCTDIGGDARHPSAVDSKDFHKWLLKNQRADNEMVVQYKWLSING
ncbi:MAG: DUF4384 domain-containing protein, partial [Muribaculaceae bacterium]|nr:DUF4384 domain-containing protein [Muribaculaceae bacterium]